MAESKKGRGKRDSSSEAHSEIDPVNESTDYWWTRKFSDLPPAAAATGSRSSRSLVADLLSVLEHRTYRLLKELEDTSSPAYNSDVSILEKNELLALIALIEAKLKASPSLRARFEASSLMSPYVERVADLAPEEPAWVSELAHRPRWSERDRSMPSRSKSHVNPRAFIESAFEKELRTGELREDHIESVQPDLMKAYRQWVRRHENDIVAKLKPALDPLELRRRRLGPSTPIEEIIRLGQALSKRQPQ